MHHQFQEAVRKNQLILKDSAQLVAILDQMKIEDSEDLHLNTADVVALYPSIDIEDGLKALDWFMETYMSDMPAETKAFMSSLARWVLQNNYVEFQGVKYHQVIGTAMGTIFSVMFANIFMLWVETPIVDKYKADIRLYKRFIDDIFVAWKGSRQRLCAFKKEFNSAHKNIQLTWQGYKKAEGYDIDTFIAKNHVSVDFMDVTITKSVEPVKSFSSDGSRQLSNLFHFRLFRKKCNAYAHLPFDSFHPRHNRIGWFRGEILRMLIRCSVLEEWLEECKRFAYLVSGRGHRWRELKQVMDRVNWNQRKELLVKALAVKPKKINQFHDKYRACVLSIRRTPRWKDTASALDLSLSEFQKECCGDIFPKQAFCTFTSSPALRTFVPKDLKAAKNNK